MKKTLKWLGYGLITWLIPFVVSFLFYDQEGNLQTSNDLFKSSMIVISSMVGCYILVLFFKGVEEQYVKEGVIFGLFLLTINWMMDLVILVPFAEMDYGFYFESIGLRYVQIPILSASRGWILSIKRS